MPKDHAGATTVVLCEAALALRGQKNGGAPEGTAEV
jgi:hypothetical protein